MPDPSQSQNSTNPLAAAPPQSDVPPIPDFQAVTNQSSPTPASDFFPPAPPNKPKKKFGSNRIVATILGVLLLVGGIGAGIVLVLQPQLLQQQAAETKYCTPFMQQDCAYGCEPDVNGGHCKNPNCVGGKGYGCGNGDVGSGGSCATTRDCSGSLQCWNGKCQTNPNNCDRDSNCADGYLCNPGTKTCEKKPGDIPTGNCRNNKGNCYVKTGIGIEENPGPDGIRDVCDGPHWTTCEVGYVCSNYDCVPQNPPKTQPPKTQPPKTPPPPSKPPTPTPTPTPSKPPTPTPPGFTMSCSNVKAYTSGWTLLSGTQLSNLKPGNNINFCVNGTASAGSFDKAKFTINGSEKAETSAKRPGSNDFCQNFTIPEGASTFTVTAQIHHVTGGWTGP